MATLLFSPMAEANTKSARPDKQKRHPQAALLVIRQKKKGLQRGFNLKTPGLEEGLRDILGILVPACPLPQAGGPDVLVRAELELLDDLLEGGHCGYNRTNGLRLAPIRISTTLCHRFGVLEER
jgi:hypothetical protein